MNALEVLTNTAILLFVGLFAFKTLGPGRTVAQVSAGDALTVEGVDWRSAKANLVVAFNSQCRFCLEGRPFYADLAKHADPSRNALTFVVPLLDLVEARRALAEGGLDQARVFGADFSRNRILGTPTLLLADSRGNVQHVWRGLLTEEEQKQVAQMFRAGNSSFSAREQP